MNKAILIGRLTDDPKTTTSKTQKGEDLTITRYTLAVDRRGEGADFIPCVAFGSLGLFSKSYFTKGMKVAVNGRIQTGNYINKEGKKVYTTEIIIEGQEFAESKRTEEPPASDDEFISVPEGIENDFPFK
ncbi:MAG: single-stranded DNA-binding protein [Paludibacteraceae bacterium]|nr:single-stranded DNA-binding protein [Paludibacteraceae bacterium]